MVGAQARNTGDDVLARLGLGNSEETLEEAKPARAGVEFVEIASCTVDTRQFNKCVREAVAPKPASSSSSPMPPPNLLEGRWPTPAESTYPEYDHQDQWGKRESPLPPRKVREKRKEVGAPPSSEVVKLDGAELRQYVADRLQSGPDCNEDYVPEAEVGGSLVRNPSASTVPEAAAPSDQGQRPNTSSADVRSASTVPDADQERVTVAPTPLKHSVNN